MLNINKIASDINVKSLTKIDVSNILKLPYTTAINRLKHGNWTPDEVEMLADYFGRTIAYYFDREEKEAKPYANEDKMRVVEDSPCQNCGLLKVKIEGLEALLDSKNETIAALRGDKKETKAPNSAQAS